MISTPNKEPKLEQNVWRRPFRIFRTAHAQITVPSVESRYWGRSFRYNRTPGLTEKSWYSESRDSEGVVWTRQEWALHTCGRWFARRFHLHGWSGTKIAAIMERNCWELVPAFLCSLYWHYRFFFNCLGCLFNREDYFQFHTDITLKRTLRAGPREVCLRESTVRVTDW